MSGSAVESDDEREVKRRRCGESLREGLFQRFADLVV
jgi:hypothetical protein